MNAYTVSRLALDAGVSVHIVRDYLLRGLLRQPQVLLLDEPTAALDEDSVSAVEDLLASRRKEGLAMLWVTHSHTQAARVASRCLRLHDRQLSPMEVVA